MKTALWGVCVIAACFCVKPANAWDGCGGYGGYGLGYLYNSLQYNVPYFAAFPPVYYSYPVPRTYGYSPFAYPPGVMTPDVIETFEPEIIENPHVPTSTEAAPKLKPEAKKDSTVAAPPASEPLVIVNPYVTEPVAAVGQAF
jgi:hypothetical protein